MSDDKSLAESIAEEHNAEESLAADRKIAALNSKLSVLNRKYKRAIAELEAAEERVEFLGDIADQAQDKAMKALGKKPGGEASAMLVLADWHCEEQVDPATINDLNTYNLEISERRIKKAFQKGPYLLEFARGFTTIKELILPVLGDMITGYIHEELEENNYLSPTEAVLFAQDQLVTGINFLLKECDVKRIVVPTCYGNHGRTGKKKRVASAYKNSYEWLMYNQLSRHYRNEPRVIWKVENGYHNWLDVQGHDVRFHHGDSIRYQGGVGGITIPVNKKIAQWNKSRKAELDVFGHYHQFLDCWSWVCSGCLIGYNAYALSIAADYQPPTQTFIVMSKTHGKVLAMPALCA